VRCKVTGRAALTRGQLQRDSCRASAGLWDRWAASAPNPL